MNIDKPGYLLRIENKTLFFTVKGSMDLPLLADIFKDVSGIIQNHLSPSWASVVDLSSWQLHTPEVASMIAKFQFWAAKHGQKSELCITSGSVLKKSARQDLLKNRPESVEYVFVDNLQEAETWLRDHSFL